MIKCTSYLLGEPRRDEWHLKSVAVRMQNVEGIRIDGAEHREDPTAEPVADLEHREKKTEKWKLMR